MVIGTALPGLLTAIKQMESVSKFYARQGFLWLLFSKVTNQLVTMCKEYIEEITLGGEMDGDDFLWQLIWKEVVEQCLELPAGVQRKMFQSILGNKLKVLSSVCRDCNVVL